MKLFVIDSGIAVIQKRADALLIKNYLNMAKNVRTALIA
jgi:hypothetical protein